MSPDIAVSPIFYLQLRQRVLEVSGWEANVLEQYDAMRGVHRNPMMLITGGPSCGQSLLAGSLRSRIEDQGGYFLTARFDHLMLPIPYQGLVSAFTDFTSMVVEKGEKEVYMMRKAIKAALGEETLVLENMIPALDVLRGRKHEERPVPVSRSMARRFVHEFRTFIGAVCSTGRPVALILENLQWADCCSLDLLTSWRADSALHDLVLVGTCDSSLSNNAYLLVALRKLENAWGSNILELKCEELYEQTLVKASNDLITTSEGNSSEIVGHLLHAKSMGKLGFLELFGEWLQHVKIVEFDYYTGKWFCDLDEVDRRMGINCVTDCILSEISHLPNQRLRWLRQLSCLSLTVDADILLCLSDQPSDLEWLRNGNRYVEYTQQGLMFRNSETRRFIYESMSVEERRSLHSEIGQRLLRRLDETRLEREIFCVLSQLFLSRTIVFKYKDSVAIANLCLRAAHKAAKLSTFRTACTYLEYGIEILGDRCWNQHYTIALALHNALAEMFLCTTSYDKMNETIALVLGKARSPEDTMQAYATKVYFLGLVSRSEEAIQTGLDAMRLLGESFPTRLLNVHLMKELMFVTRKLRRKTDEQLLRIPPMTDERKLACMRILQLMLVHASIWKNELVAFVELRLMKLTLQHGLSVFAAVAFAAHGLIHTHVYKDWVGGYRYGQLAIRLLEKHGSVEFIPRVYAFFYGILSPLTRSSRESLGPLKVGLQIAVETGDIECVGLCVCMVINESLIANVPLDAVTREYEENKQYLIAHDHRSLMKLTIPMVEAVYRYTGRSPDPFASKGLLIDYDQAMHEAESEHDHVRRVQLKITRLIISMVFNDFETACKFVPNKREMDIIPEAHVAAEIQLYSGIVMIAHARTRSWTLRQRLSRSLNRTSKHLNHVALINPESFLHRAFLFDAEVASHRGQNAVALAKYTCAISIAKTYEYYFYEAFANELAARHFLRLKQHEEARSYFEHACDSYLKWGATAKCELLRAEISSTF